MIIIATAKIRNVSDARWMPVSTFRLLFFRRRKKQSLQPSLLNIRLLGSANIGLLAIGSATTRNTALHDNGDIF